MTNECSEAHWYVIHTHPKQESRAALNLDAWQVETFAPRIRDQRYNYVGVLVQVPKPLFPRYIFARFKAQELLHKVRFTRGVRDVVNFGGNPIAVDDDLIVVIQARLDRDGHVRIDDKIEPGTEVLVKDGPFKDFTAIFERETKDANRVRILLKAVTYQAHVVIERGLIQRHNRSLH